MPSAPADFPGLRLSMAEVISVHEKGFEEQKL